MYFTESSTCILTNVLLFMNGLYNDNDFSSRVVHVMSDMMETVSGLFRYIVSMVSAHTHTKLASESGPLYI